MTVSVIKKMTERVSLNVTLVFVFPENVSTNKARHNKKFLPSGM